MPFRGHYIIFSMNTAVVKLADIDCLATLLENGTEGLKLKEFREALFSLLAILPLLMSKPTDRIADTFKCFNDANRDTRRARTYALTEFGWFVYNDLKKAAQGNEKECNTKILNWIAEIKQNPKDFLSNLEHGKPLTPYCLGDSEDETEPQTPPIKKRRSSPPPRPRKKKRDRLPSAEDTGYISV